jgi:hypothetical protein
MYFDEISPWRNAVMSSKSETAKLAAGGVKSGGAAHTGILSIGANYPATRWKRIRMHYGGAPKHAYT